MYIYLTNYGINLKKLNIKPERIIGDMYIYTFVYIHVIFLYYQQRFFYI